MIGQKQTRTDLGSVSFKVRDFEPDRMKVSLSLHDTPVQGWIPPDQVVAKSPPCTCSALRRRAAA